MQGGAGGSKGAKGKKGKKAALTKGGGGTGSTVPQSDSQPHISLGPLPRLQDMVTVVGYPVGGDNQSVTQGVVSRIEMSEYVHGASELLAIQIDAAINSGNSGGPAFNSAGLCVGIAFQSLKDGDSENIGYVIPSR